MVRLDSLNVRAVILDDGQDRVAFVLFDLIVIGDEDAARVRDLVDAANGVPPANVSISCTHAHCAPCLLAPLHSTRNESILSGFYRVSRPANVRQLRTCNLLQPLISQLFSGC